MRRKIEATYTWLFDQGKVIGWVNCHVDNTEKSRRGKAKMLWYIIWWLHLAVMIFTDITGESSPTRSTLTGKFIDAINTSATILTLVTSISTCTFINICWRKIYTHRPTQLCCYLSDLLVSLLKEWEMRSTWKNNGGKDTPQFQLKQPSSKLMGSQWEWSWWFEWFDEKKNAECKIIKSLFFNTVLFYVLVWLRTMSVK